MNFITFKSSLGYITIYSKNKKINSVTIDEHLEELLTKDMILLNAKEQIEEYLSGKRTIFELNLKLEGTPFQLKVWNELLKLNYGEIISYGDLAKRIDNEKSYRAVGNAVGKNPIPIIVPCHRIIKSDGSLGGFSLDIAIKKQLIKLETNSKITIKDL